MSNLKNGRPRSKMVSRSLMSNEKAAFIVGARQSEDEGGYSTCTSSTANKNEVSSSSCSCPSSTTRSTSKRRTSSSPSSQHGDLDGEENATKEEEVEESAGAGGDEFNFAVGDLIQRNALNNYQQQEAFIAQSGEDDRDEVEEQATGMDDGEENQDEKEAPPPPPDDPKEALAPTSDERKEDELSDQFKKRRSSEEDNNNKEKKKPRGKKKNKTASNKRGEDDGMPKRALTAYNIFYQDVSKEIASEGLTFSGIGKRVGQLWRDIPPEQLQVYKRRAGLDRVRYENEMRTYFMEQEAKKERSSRSRNHQSIMPSTTAAAAPAAPLRSSSVQQIYNRSLGSERTAPPAPATQHDIFQQFEIGQQGEATIPAAVSAVGYLRLLEALHFHQQQEARRIVSGQQQLASDHQEQEGGCTSVSNPQLQGTREQDRQRFFVEEVARAPSSLQQATREQGQQERTLLTQLILSRARAGLPAARQQPDTLIEGTRDQSQDTAAMLLWHLARNGEYQRQGQQGGGGQGPSKKTFF